MKGSWSSLEELHSWSSDKFPELHREDMLWASAIRCSEDLEDWRGTLKDSVLWYLLKDGLFNWDCDSDCKHPQVLLAMRHSTVLSARLVKWIKDLEDRVGPFFDFVLKATERTSTA